MIDSCGEYVSKSYINYNSKLFKLNTKGIES